MPTRPPMANNAGPGSAELPAEDKVTDWRAVALFLHGLLDNIDTAEDAAKSNDAAYRAMVHKYQRKRFEVSVTDGYEVRFFDREP